LRRVLVLGGVRSGKSGYAERLAAEMGDEVVYVATATASDDEMRERILRHRAQRPATWRTVEASMGLAAATAAAGREMGSRPTVLVEDLTLLLSNLLDVDVPAAEGRAKAEIEALLDLQANVILVSNEVGMGIVPAYPSGRAFRDAMGRLNQQAAGLCKEVYFLIAGLPLRLK
jgi:adenosylcobinamide kinase/adenosylcobinamide-phosphate guanylyltransferase